MDQRGGGDRIYEMLEGRGGEGKGKEGDGGGGERKPRSEEEMRQEADWLRSELERDGVLSTGLMDGTGRGGPMEAGSGRVEGGKDGVAPGSGENDGPFFSWRTVARDLAWVLVGFGLSSIYLSNRRNT